MITPAKDIGYHKTSGKGYIWVDDSKGGLVVRNRNTGDEYLKIKEDGSIPNLGFVTVGTDTKYDTAAKIADVISNVQETTVLVKNGTYTFTSKLSIPNADTIIQGESLSAQFRFDTSLAECIQLVNQRSAIKNMSIMFDTGAAYADGKGIQIVSSYCTIDKCNVQSTFDDTYTLIDIYKINHNTDITGNNIYGSSSSYSVTGIVAGGSNYKLYISRNLIHDLSDGLLADHSKELTIYRNNIYDIGAGDAIYLNESSDYRNTPDPSGQLFKEVEVTSNNLYNCGGKGLIVYKTGDILIQGNSFRDITGKHIEATHYAVANHNRLTMIGNFSDDSTKIDYSGWEPEGYAIQNGNSWQTNKVAYGESEGETASTLTTWTNKLATSYIPEASGDYTIEYQWECKNQDNDSVTCVQVCEGVTELSYFRGSGHAVGQGQVFYQPYGGFKRMSLTAGTTYNFYIKFASNSNGDFAYIRRARLLIKNANDNG